MNYNFSFNVDPYLSHMSHIPYTQYKSGNTVDAKIVFVYNSIVNKFDLFEKSLLSLHDAIRAFSPENAVATTKDGEVAGYGAVKSDVLSDSDNHALEELNTVFKPYFGDMLLTTMAPCNESLPLHFLEDYMRASGPNVEEISQLVEEPNNETYPYDLNIVDTGVPTELYYRIKVLSNTLVVVVVYEHFFDYLLKENAMNAFLRHVLIKLHEILTIEQIARLPVFQHYIKTL